VEEDPMEWNRIDSGDITSKSLADSLMHKWMKELDPLQKKRKQMWFQSALTVIDPRLDYEYLLHADEIEFGNIFRDFVPTNIYYKYVSEYYWPKLMSFLNSDNT
jgi:hypothetical protein